MTDHVPLTAEDWDAMTDPKRLDRDRSTPSVDGLREALVKGQRDAESEYRRAQTGTEAEAYHNGRMVAYMDAIEAYDAALAATPTPAATTMSAPEKTIGTTRFDANRSVQDATVDFLAEKEARFRAALPPGPYRVVWPDKQGGAFSVWGTGWAIPVVAWGVQSVMEALAEYLNTAALAAIPTPAPEPRD